MKKRVNVRRPWLGRAMLMVALALASRPVAAQDGAEAPACEAPGERETAVAKEAFKAGQAALNEGDYARAVEHWTRAYRQDCTAHALLLNLAMARELLGRPEDAIRALEQFNSRVPDSPYVAPNLERIERLRARAAEQARERERVRPAAVSKPVIVRSSLEQRQSSLDVPLPWVVVGTGGLAAVIGAVMYAEGRYAAADAAARCGSGAASCADPDAVVRGERARARAEIGGWSLTGGLVVAAAGAVWRLLEGGRSPTERGETRMAWDAALSESAAEVRVSGSF